MDSIEWSIGLHLSKNTHNIRRISQRKITSNAWHDKSLSKSHVFKF